MTTGGEDAEKRQKLIDAIMAQYEEIRGSKYESPSTEPIYLGELSDHALKFVSVSSTKKMERLGEIPEPHRISA